MGKPSLWVAIGSSSKAFSDLVYCYLTGINRIITTGWPIFEVVFVVDYSADRQLPVLPGWFTHPLESSHDFCPCSSTQSEIQ